MKTFVLIMSPFFFLPVFNAVGFVFSYSAAKLFNEKFKQGQQSSGGNFYRVDNRDPESQRPVQFNVRSNN